MSRPQHICHITTVHPSKDVRIFRKECISLAKAGYKVTLIVVNGESEQVDGVEILGVPVEFGNRLQRFSKATKAAYQKALDLKADLYHFHDPEFLPYGVRLMETGVPVIFDSHENTGQQILSKHYIPPPLRKLISKLYHGYEQRKARKLSAIITATEHINDYFSNFHRKVVSVMNYPMLHEVPEKPSHDKRETKVAYVGSITAIRGAREMVEAMETVEGQLMLGGSFSPAALENELESGPGWNKVEVLGYLNREQIWNLYSTCSVGLVLFWPEPNHVEAQPNKIFEYMMAGLPVIGSHFPLWKDIIETEDCGICVDPMDTKAISEAINTILQNKEQSIAMGQRGRKAVEERYNWSKEEAKLLSLYQDLLSTRS